MILAGFLLLCIGLVDVLRRFVPPRTRWFVIGGVGLVLLVIGAVANAVVPVLISLALAALWVWAMPSVGKAPLSFWPAVLLAALSTGAVAFGPARTDAGVFGAGWTIPAFGGVVSFDLVVLAVGVFLVLLETGNLVVRAALESEHAMVPADEQEEVVAAAQEAAAVEAADPPSADPPSTGFRGGRLIGPLERVIVLLLTLAGAFPLLAAMLAAKGIVRFPEISRDGDSGARAEYFLVGSLVSWVIALGGAFLVWWGAA